MQLRASVITGEASRIRFVPFGMQSVPDDIHLPLNGIGFTSTGIRVSVTAMPFATSALPFVANGDRDEAFQNNVDLKLSHPAINGISLGTNGSPVVANPFPVMANPSSVAVNGLPFAVNRFPVVTNPFCFSARLKLFTSFRISFAAPVSCPIAIGTGVTRNPSSLVADSTSFVTTTKVFVTSEVQFVAKEIAGGPRWVQFVR